MTIAARRVLNDCRIALNLLESDQEDEHWRIHWAAAVALIRAVGHVLQKVDGARSNVASEAIALAYKSWKTGSERHEIFTEFIERERNNLLKEYRTDVHPFTEASLAVEMNVIRKSDGEPFVVREVLIIGENIYRPMLDGLYEGNDARDVLEMAIEWWECELDQIDKSIDSTFHNSVRGTNLVKKWPFD